MKSFSSTLNRAGSASGYGEGFTDDGRFGDTTGINFNLSLDDITKQDLIEHVDFTEQETELHNESNTVILDTYKEYSAGYEDAYKMPSIVLSSFNNYKFLYEHSVQSRSSIYQINAKNVKVLVDAVPATPSIFNPIFAVNARGFMKGVPMLFTNGINKSVKNIVAKEDKGNLTWSNSEYNSVDLSDCSIHRLVSLSEGTIYAGGKISANLLHNIMGLSTYKYADFMYCKDLGKVSNNHLITLRKFPYPVGDNIFIGAIARTDTENESTKSEPMPADVGRLVTWFGTEDNKLEDIMNYEMKMSWKDLSATILQQDSQEDSSDKPLNSIINSLSPQYNAYQQGGFSKGANIWSLMGSNATGWKGALSSNGPYDNTTLRNYDENKVYTPKNTIQDTVLYEGKLTYSQEFTLNFCYKLRAYDNINPKSAFLDLLGNILEVSYRRGKFWGGERKLNGAPRNTSAWKTANAFINNAWDKLGGFLEALFRGNIDFSSLLASASELVSNAKDTATDMVNSASSQGLSGLANKAVDAFKKFNAATGLTNGLKGQLMNSLGRPALYAWNSLLSAAPVGLWHVTIGNPLNPIAAFGNMIVTSAKITHSGPLGIDDFPTELKVAITLKHARSRDITEISRMYTRGAGTLYNPLAQNAISRYIKTSAAGAAATTKEMTAKWKAAQAAQASQAEENAKTTNSTTKSDNSNQSNVSTVNNDTSYNSSYSSATKVTAEDKRNLYTSYMESADGEADFNNLIDSYKQGLVTEVSESELSSFFNTNYDNASSMWVSQTFTGPGSTDIVCLQHNVDETA